MEWLAIDVLPQSRQGNNYILIAADYFTKWVEPILWQIRRQSIVAEVLFKL